MSETAVFPSMPPPPAIQRALAAFHAAKFDLARQELQAHLARVPGDTEAWYLLGVSAQAGQRAEEALQAFDKVLAADSRHTGTHYSKALLLASLGRHAEALAHHDAAIRLAPDNFWACVNRGNSQAALGHFEAALADYDRALTIQPDLPEALTNKGNALTELRRYEDALACLDRALTLRPQHLQAWVNRSFTLARLKRYGAALETAEQATRLEPRYGRGWLARGVALNELGHPAEALASQEQALGLSPDDPEVWMHRGDALNDLNRHEEALASYDKAIALKPDYARAYCNRGIVLAELDRDAEALASYEQALALQPDFHDAHWNQSFVHLKLENYAQGWEKYEHRWDINNPDIVRLETARPRWRGDRSHNKLLIWAEQGIGDQVLFGGVLPELAAFPQEKCVALDKRLIPLFQRAMPGFEFVDLEQVSDALDFAEQLPIGSLPRLFRMTQQSFDQARHPYLRADRARVEALRQRVSQPGKRICGVSWSSKRKGIGQHKSIGLAQMLPPLASDGLHFVNLQYGDTRPERDALEQAHGIRLQDVEEVDNFNDIDGLAALIEACDVILTTSNTTAHLAGALGKETLLLLPFGKGRLWYWANRQGRNPWYPSIRMYAQQTPGDWQRPLADIKSSLENKSWT